MSRREKHSPLEAAMCNSIRDINFIHEKLNVRGDFKNKIYFSWNVLQPSAKEYFCKLVQMQSYR